MSGDCVPVIIGGLRIPCDRRDQSAGQFHAHRYCHAFLEDVEAEVSWVRVERSSAKGER